MSTALDTERMRNASMLRILAMDLTAPDARTSQADARAAVCLAHGVPAEFISALGYDHTDRAYVYVRGTWVRHIRQFGFHLPVGWDLADSDVYWAHGLWLEVRPELAAGDDWLTAGWEAHERSYPDGCDRSCDLCHTKLITEEK